ncbi:hypothetical protein QJQ45_027368, partial [Haematococcus lacustris]
RRVNDVGRTYSEKPHNPLSLGPLCRMSAPAARFLAGKAALVTGSTSGIGLAVIKALAGAGADVALNGIASSQEVQRLRDQIAAETGVKVVYADADLRKPAQIRDAVKRVADELGRLDIVHNNAGRSTPTPGEHSDYHPHSQPHLPSHSHTAPTPAPASVDPAPAPAPVVPALAPPPAPAAVLLCAGIQFVAPVESYPEDKWDAIMDVCLNSTFHVTKAALPYMLQRGWGRVINTVSQAVQGSDWGPTAAGALGLGRAGQGGTGQGVDKRTSREGQGLHALLGGLPLQVSLQRSQARRGRLHQGKWSQQEPAVAAQQCQRCSQGSYTSACMHACLPACLLAPPWLQTLALEVATKGVTVNAICPGYVLTDLVKNQIKDQAKTRGVTEDQVISQVMLADQPTKQLQFVKPEDIAGLVLHLCGPHSSSITGACLSIDGGWVAR